jgi:hypothetical protein
MSATLNHTPVSPVINAFAKDCRGGYAPNFVAKAHAELLATLTAPRTLKGDLRGAFNMDAETADYAMDTLKTVTEAWAAYINAILTDHEVNGATIGSLMAGNPYDNDLYVHFDGEDR